MTSQISVSNGILDVPRFGIKKNKKQIIVKRDAPLGEGF